MVEESHEEQLEDDEIDSGEAGFLQGYEEAGEETDEEKEKEEE